MKKWKRSALKCSSVSQLRASQGKSDMCGIVGIVDLSENPIDKSILVRMNDAVQHRGPDDEGYTFIDQPGKTHAGFSGPDSPPQIRHAFPSVLSPKNTIPANIGFAHRRFSIIDLTPGGHQPFIDTSDLCCVIFNGEVYNYIEMREKLERRWHVFRFGSDTEGIVEAYKA